MTNIFVSNFDFDQVGDRPEVQGSREKKETTRETDRPDYYTEHPLISPL